MPFSPGHALLIGIGDHRSAPVRPLPAVEGDVDVIAATLRDPVRCGYPADQVTVLKGAQATRAAALAALDSMAALGPEDLALIYLTGYGAIGADGVYQLATAETQWAGGQAHAGAALRADELIDRLRRIKVRRLLLIINAYAPDTVSPGAEESETLWGAPPPAYLLDAALATGAGRAIIAAAREQEVAYVGHGENTPFARALIDGLAGKTTLRREGYISAFDLYQALYDGLSTWVPQLVRSEPRLRFGGKQQPELIVGEQNGSYAVALWRGAETRTPGVFAEPPPADMPVRIVTEHKSRHALEAALADLAAAQGSTIVQGNQGPTAAQHGGGLNMGAGNTFGNVSVGNVIGRDINHFGTIIQPTGPVTQVFGDQQTIYTETHIENRTTTVPPQPGGGQPSGGFGATGVPYVTASLIQRIDAISSGSQSQLAELRSLAAQLGSATGSISAAYAHDVAAVVDLTRQLIDALGQAPASPALVNAHSDRLAAAGGRLTGAATEVGALAQRIAALGLDLQSSQ